MPENTPAPHAAQARSRAKARLRILGIDVDAMDEEQVRVSFQAQRDAFLHLAHAGLHTHPVHLEHDPFPGACVDSRYGMLIDAITDYYGTWPAGWAAPRPSWPSPGPPVPTGTVAQGAAPAVNPLAALEAGPAGGPRAPREIGRARSRWDAPAEEPDPADHAPATPEDEDDQAFRHWRT